MNRLWRFSFIFVLPTIPTLTLLAQENLRPDTTGLRSIEQQILSQPDPDAVRLGKARAALFTALQAGDIPTARKTLQYIDERFDTAFVAPLYPGERLLTSYFVAEYQAIFQMTTSGEDQLSLRYGKTTPMADHLFARMRDLALQNRRGLVESIRSSGQSREERDFLLLLLRDILAPHGDNTELNTSTQDSINVQADDFLADYPASPFIPFVRRQIRFVVRPSPWGFGYNFGIGYLAVPSRMRAFGDYVDLAFGAEGAYFDWYAELRLDIGAGHKTSAPFEYKGTWPKDMMAYPVGGVISAGRMFALSSLFRVTPFLSIGGLDFSSSQEERDMGRDFSMGVWYWGPGGHLDLIMGEEFFIRITASARFNFAHADIAGSQYTFVTFGLGWFNHPSERDF